MPTTEIEWAERNSSLPYCRYRADRWAKKEEIVMLSLKPRGALQNDCWSALTDCKGERSRFLKSRYHLCFALLGKSPCLPQPPQMGWPNSLWSTRVLAPELIWTSAVEEILNFPDRRRSWSQATSSSICWNSGRAGLSLQLPQAGNPNASICCCPGHCHLPGPYQHGQGALLSWLSAAVNICSFCWCLSSRENHPVCRIACKSQNKNWEMGSGSLLGSGRSALPFLTFFFHLHN